MSTTEPMRPRDVRRFRLHRGRRRPTRGEVPALDVASRCVVPAQFLADMPRWALAEDPFTIEEMA